jgi:Protein of unknown function (DUF2459)
VAPAPGTGLIRPLLKWSGRVAAVLALAFALYLLSAWIGSSLPRNGDWEEPEHPDYVVGVETNGVHTALILPLVTPAKDWREAFPLTDVARPDRPYTHISISWGERAVFLDTPTWWDLSPRTVLRVLTVGGEGLLHIGYYVRPAASDTLRPIRLRADEYARLVKSIEEDLPVRRPLRRHPQTSSTTQGGDTPRSTRATSGLAIGWRTLEYGQVAGLRWQAA